MTLADIGSKKGGSKNEPFMKKWNELFPGGFKDVNDKELLEKAVETLSQIPDYDTWQAELAKNKEETEETNKEEKVNE